MLKAVLTPVRASITSSYSPSISPSTLLGWNRTTWVMKDLLNRYKLSSENSQTKNLNVAHKDESLAVRASKCKELEDISEQTADRNIENRKPGTVGNNIDDFCMTDINLEDEIDMGKLSTMTDFHRDIMLQRRKIFMKRAKKMMKKSRKQSLNKYKMISNVGIALFSPSKQTLEKRPSSTATDTTNGSDIAKSIASLLSPKPSANNGKSHTVEKSVEVMNTQCDKALSQEETKSPGEAKTASPVVQNTEASSKSAMSPSTCETDKTSTSSVILREGVTKKLSENTAETIVIPVIMSPKTVTNKASTTSRRRTRKPRKKQQNVPLRRSSRLAKKGKTINYCV